MSSPVPRLVAALGSLLGDPELWITRALVVLVAASPCALAIAVPVNDGMQHPADRAAS